VGKTHFFYKNRAICFISLFSVTFSKFKYMDKLVKFIENIRENFRYNGKEKMAKISLLLLLMLDIFVFIAINYGLSFQRDVINSPMSAEDLQNRKM
jgi:hypothetical protein